MPPRLFFILNPGRQSRHYIQGLIAAAHRLQIPYITFELDQVWKRVESAADKPAAIRDIQAQVARVITSRQITHAIGYIHNGVFDLGLVKAADGPPRSLLTSLGVRHLLLWTDHPEWALDGTCIRPPVIDHLCDPGLFHLLKSESAAAEAAAVLRWPNARAMPMAEDYDSLPVQSITPIHDIVLIRGDAAPIPAIIQPFLNHPDPDPAELDALMRPAALDAFASEFPEHAALARAWLDAKSADPARSFWHYARSLPAPGDSLDFFRADPRRWYTALAALRIMVHWRRNFWPAWLARRVNVGTYGSPAHDPAFNQSAQAAQWVPYEHQSSTYARGRIALNINAAHDEEGLTHKPFQIAAASAPCIHHATRGLKHCFADQEVLTFSRGPELLAHVHSLLNDESARAALAQAMHARARRNHTWDQRLQHMLSVAS